MFDYDAKWSRESVVSAMRPNAKLNPYAFACAMQECVECGVRPSTPAALQELLEKDAEVVSLNAYYEDNPSKWTYLGMDTQDREIVMRAVAEVFTGRDWPTYGEGETVYDAFEKTLSENLIRSGWAYTG